MVRGAQDIRHVVTDAQFPHIAGAGEVDGSGNADRVRGGRKEMSLGRRAGRAIVGEPDFPADGIYERLVIRRHAGPAEAHLIGERARRDVVQGQAVAYRVAGYCDAGKTGGATGVRGGCRRPDSEKDREPAANHFFGVPWPGFSVTARMRFSRLSIW